MHARPPRAALRVNPTAISACSSDSPPDSAPAHEDDETLLPMTLPPQRGGAPIERGTCYYVGTPIGNLEEQWPRGVLAGGGSLGGLLARPACLACRPVQDLAYRPVRCAYELGELA